MAYQVGGKAAKTGMPVTPAPTAKLTEAEARSKSWGREAYGTNGYAGPASVAPGKSITSPLADELKRAGTDGVLDIVIAKGTSKNDSLAAFGNVQDKGGAVSVRPLPTTHGTRDANSGPRSGGDPSVPSAIDASGGPLPRLPS